MTGQSTHAGSGDIHGNAAAELLAPGSWLVFDLLNKLRVTTLAGSIVMHRTTQRIGNGRASCRGGHWSGINSSLDRGPAGRQAAYAASEWPQAPSLYCLLHASCICYARPETRAHRRQERHAGYAVDFGFSGGARHLHTQNKIGACFPWANGPCCTVARETWQVPVKPKRVLIGMPLKTHLWRLIPPCYSNASHPPGSRMLALRPQVTNMLLCHERIRHGTEANVAIRLLVSPCENQVTTKIERGELCQMASGSYLLQGRNHDISINATITPRQCNDTRPSHTLT